MAFLSTVQQASITGLAPSFTAVSASDTLAPEERTCLHVKNAGGSSDNAVVVIPGSTYAQANPDITVAVPATTGYQIIGPFTPAMADPTTGLVTITHSFTTSVTCALVRQ